MSIHDKVRSVIIEEINATESRVNECAARNSDRPSAREECIGLYYSTLTQDIYRSAQNQMNHLGVSSETRERINYALGNAYYSYYLAIKPHYNCDHIHVNNVCIDKCDEATNILLGYFSSYYRNPYPNTRIHPGHFLEERLWKC